MRISDYLDALAQARLVLGDVEVCDVSEQVYSNKQVILVMYWNGDGTVSTFEYDVKGE